MVGSRIGLASNGKSQISASIAAHRTLWFRLKVTTRAAAILAAAFLCLQGQLQAQLRSGRGTRSLYQPSVRDAGTTQRSGRPVDTEQHSRRRVDHSVVTASYTDDLEFQEVIGPEPVVSNTASSCASCAANGHSSYGMADYGHAPTACDSCCSNASIAPMATGFCMPGCGPLMSLWQRMSVRAEVPMFWRRDQGPPILVTTADAGTAADVAGEIGQPTTTVLFGNGAISDDAEAGIRLTMGTWIGANKCYGVIFRYWNAGDQDISESFSSNQFPILARPFFNTTVAAAPEQDTQLVAFPNESIGSIRVDMNSSVDGVDLMLRGQLLQDRFTKLDWLWGYQNVNIDESLSVFSDTTVTGNQQPGLQGTMIAVSDNFRTENEFHGFVYGLRSTRRIACWQLETMFRLGAGNLRRKVNIFGSTTTTSGGASSIVNQGLLARNTNSQPFVDDTFVVVPELAINLAYRIRPCLDFNLGYHYMVIPKVAQAAQQIDNDLAVNLSDPLSGNLDPALDFNERQYWLHSLGFGLQWRY